MSRAFIIIPYSFSEAITCSSVDIVASSAERVARELNKLLARMYFSIDNNGTNLDKFNSEVVTTTPMTIREFFHEILWYIDDKSNATIEAFIDNNWKLRVNKIVPESTVVIVKSAKNDSMPWWMQTFLHEELNGAAFKLG